MSDLLKINVNDFTEKKNGLTYLSWAHAWTEVLKIDPQATWEAVEFNGLPCTFLPDSTALVKVLVTIKGHTKASWLPVIDHRNKPIPGPNAFHINTAIVRCMTKAISMHGLGLYIYAGEDLPEEESSTKVQAIKQPALGGIGDDLTPKQQTHLKELAAWITDNADDATTVREELAVQDLDETQLLYMQSFLNPAVRKALGMTYKKAA
jgi:Protein of unknown function (DUF1071)